MMFVPSSYSHRYPSAYAGVHTGAYGFTEPSALMADLNSADRTITSTLPKLKMAISFIRKVKPNRTWGRSFRPRWLLWKKINENALPKMVQAYKDMQSAQKKIRAIKDAIS